MSLIQILILVVVLAVWWRLFLRYRAGELALFRFLEWFVLWLAVGAVAVAPDSTTRVAQSLGVGRGSDLVVYLALLLAFYLFARLFVRLERLERNITKVVREQAVRSAQDGAPQTTAGRGSAETA